MKPLVRSTTLTPWWLVDLEPFLNGSEYHLYERLSDGTRTYRGYASAESLAPWLFP